MTNDTKPVIVRSVELDAILAAVEFGYRQCEKGHNLQTTLEMAMEYHYHIKPNRENT